MKKKKIIIIDDHKSIGDGLKSLFKDNDFFEVIADFDNEENLFNFLDTNNADLLLMDLHLHSANGLELTKRSKMQFPKIKV